MVGKVSPVELAPLESVIWKVEGIRGPGEALRGNGKLPPEAHRPTTSLPLHQFPSKSTL